MRKKRTPDQAAAALGWTLVKSFTAESGRLYTICDTGSEYEPFAVHNFDGAFNYGTYHWTYGEARVALAKRIGA